MEQFRIIGYYISEVIDMPGYLKELGKKMLSVSSCLGEMHPRLECCFVNGWRKGEQQAYQKKLKLNDEQYADYAETVGRLFAAKRLDNDCRFVYLSDAENFFQKFCKEIPCRLVSVSTMPAYFEILLEELGNSCSNGPIGGEPDQNIQIGCDILGWDIGGFHSFLCNSLQEELPEAVFNDIGLLRNDFQEVMEFASRIEGRGEPVDWIPCRIGEVGKYEVQMHRNMEMHG